MLLFDIIEFVIICEVVVEGGVWDKDVFFGDVCDEGGVVEDLELIEFIWRRLWCLFW